MNWAALLGGLIGAGIGSLAAVWAVAMLVWRSYRKTITQPGVTAPAAPTAAVPEPALRLVKTDTDEQPESAS